MRLEYDYATIPGRKVLMMMLMTFFLLQAAAAAPETASQTAAVAQPEDAKVVCKSVTITGSRLGAKRLCLSKKEWRRMDREAEETTRFYQDNYSKQPGNQ